MKQKITWILNDFIGKELTNWYYYSLGPDGAASNGNGIDIVPMGVELVFLNGESFILSWGTGMKGGLYGLNIFNKYEAVFNPTADVAKVQGKHKYWEALLSNVFTGYTIYGYKEVPMLIEFAFSEKSVGITNCYEETDFIPRYAGGDDIWILHGKENIQSYIEQTGLKVL